MDGITATEEIKKHAPAAGVIMMSVQSEADYLRRAMIAGARDYLTKPISGEDLSETIRRVFESMAVERKKAAAVPVQPGGGPAGPTPVGAALGHIISVYSPQGGAGVTTIASNMAVALMREGTRVLLVDADLQFGDVGVFLNLQSNHTILDLTEAVAELDDDLVQSVLVSHGTGLKVLLAPQSPEDAARVVPGDVAEIIRQISGTFDYVIVDMSKMLDDVALNLLDMSDRIVVVTTPTLPAIKSVRMILDLFQTLEYPENKVVFVMNRVNLEAKGRAAIPVEAIEKNLRRRTDARIPLNEAVFLSAVNTGVSVIATDPSKSPASELIFLAEQVRKSLAGAMQDVLDDDDPMQDQKRGLSGIFRGRN
jgi:pilus assembly protein CpaE